MKLQYLLEFLLHTPIVLELLEKYISIFQKLHIDRAHGEPAPNKPILLLSVLQLILSCFITDRRIYLTPELVALFKSNWSILVKSDKECRFTYPFYHLKGDKFWKLVPRSGFENINQMGTVMKSFSSLNAAVDHAVIDEDLFVLAKDKESNHVLQQVLLSTYFPETKIILF